MGRPRARRLGAAAAASSRTRLLPAPRVAAVVAVRAAACARAVVAVLLAEAAVDRASLHGRIWRSRSSSAAARAPPRTRAHVLRRRRSSALVARRARRTAARGACARAAPRARGAAPHWSSADRRARGGGRWRAARCSTRRVARRRRRARGPRCAPGGARLLASLRRLSLGCVACSLAALAITRRALSLGRVRRAARSLWLRRAMLCSASRIRVARSGRVGGLASMRQAGVRCVCSVASDGADVLRLCSCRSHPPLAGVLHAAGVLATRGCSLDGLARTMSMQSMCLSPRRRWARAQRLQAARAARPLEAFRLFSSKGVHVWQRRPGATTRLPTRASTRRTRSSRRHGASVLSRGGAVQIPARGWLRAWVPPRAQRFARSGCDRHGRHLARRRGVPSCSLHVPARRRRRRRPMDAMARAHARPPRRRRAALRSWRRTRARRARRAPPRAAPPPPRLGSRARSARVARISAPPHAREASVLRVVRELTGAPRVVSLTAETPLMEAGVDSLAATELVAAARARSRRGALADARLRAADAARGRGAPARAGEGGGGMSRVGGGERCSRVRRWRAARALGGRERPLARAVRRGCEAGAWLGCSGLRRRVRQRAVDAVGARLAATRAR